MREYRITVFEEETPDTKGMFGLNFTDDDSDSEDEYSSGVVRCGWADAVFWIETMERLRREGQRC